MVNFKLHLKHTVAASVLSFMAFLPLHAASQTVTDPSGDLEAMMLQLRDAEPGQAETIANRIRNEWDKSGSASADFLLKRAEKAREIGDLPGAIEHLTALTDHAPDFAAGWAARARVFFELDRYGQAIGDLEHALAINPQHFDALMGLALLLDEMGRSEDAYEAYVMVKAIHPHQAGLTEALSRLEPLVRGRDL